MRIFEGLWPLQRSDITPEIVAGATLAALAIPEVLGYAAIAGMPVVTGLYTMLLPAVAFALLGSSRHLVVGADSATAAILAGGLTVLAGQGTPQYVGLAGLAAFIVAALLIGARLVRLGFLADFLSRSVLIGFLTGVGAQVAIGQLPAMLGLHTEARNALGVLISDAARITQADVLSVALSLGVVAITLGLRVTARPIPGPLIAVIAALVLSRQLGLAGHGISVVGPVIGGPPRLGLPAMDVNTMSRLLSMCLAMFFVILAQSAATSRAYAARYDERVDEHQDLIGLGAANLLAAVSGAFVVNGSPTKTQMVDGAGGRTQLSQLTAAVVALLVLLFLTGPLEYLPLPALSAIVFLIGLELIDVKGLRDVLRMQPAEFVVALITALAVLIVGVEQGILLAMGLSLLEHVRQGYKPINTLLVRDDRGHWHFKPVTSHAQAAPGLIIYRFNHSMYYANAPRFLDEVRALTQSSQTPVHWFCFDADPVDDVDFSACMTLTQVQASLAAKGIRLVFASVADNVRAELDRAGITAAVGPDAYFGTLSRVLEAHAREVRGSLAATGEQPGPAGRPDSAA